MDRRYLLTSILLLLCQSTPAAIFTFDDLFPFDTTPLTIIGDGIAGTFSSPQGGVFLVAPTDAFSTLVGNSLVDSDTEMNQLDIVFSEPLRSISMFFALNTPLLSDVLRLDAMLAGSIVGSNSAIGSVPPGFSFPEGNLSFSGAIFDQVRLSSSAVDFAIDNVNVTSASIPETSAVLLVGAGLAVLAIAFAWRRLA